MALWWCEGPDGGIGRALGRRPLKVAPPLVTCLSRDIPPGLIILKNRVFLDDDEEGAFVLATDEEISISNNTTHMITNEEG